MIHGVIADDLTGAMEVGLQAHRHGHRVVVVFPEYVDGTFSWIDGDSFGPEAIDILVVDTETRNLTHNETKPRIKAAIRLLNSLGFPLRYKKIDSVLRGNIGAELSAVLGAEFHAVALAPALPAAGRTTQKGIHYVHGVPVAHSREGRDPFSPVGTSIVEEIVHSQSNLTCTLVDLFTLRSGLWALKNQVEEAFSTGSGVIIFDCETEGDLEILSLVIREDLQSSPLLPVGSAGLYARLLTERTGAVGREYDIPSINPPGKENQKRGILILSGSLSESSRKQIEEVVRSGQHSDHAVMIPPPSEPAILGSLREIEKEADSTINKLSSLIEAGTHVVHDISRATSIGDDPKLTKSVSAKLQSYLGLVASGLISRVQPAGLVLLGGDSAATVFLALGIRGVRILKEVEPLVPLGLAIGGVVPELPIVTKSGSLGSTEVIRSALRVIVRGR